MSNLTNVYIVDGARTAFGGFGQAFKQVSATELGVASAKAALERAKVEASEVDQVIYGNVIPSSITAAYVARHIALQTGIPVEVPALLVNRVCGSGLQSVISGAQSIKLGEAGFVLAGGQRICPKLHMLILAVASALSSAVFSWRICFSIR